MPLHAPGSIRARPESVVVASEPTVGVYVLADVRFRQIRIGRSGHNYNCYALRLACSKRANRRPTQTMAKGLLCSSAPIVTLIANDGKRLDVAGNRHFKARV